MIIIITYNGNKKLYKHIHLQSFTIIKVLSLATKPTQARNTILNFLTKQRTTITKTFKYSYFMYGSSNIQIIFLFISFIKSLLSNAITGAYFKISNNNFKLKNSPINLDFKATKRPLSTKLLTRFNKQIGFSPKNYKVLY